ncbi:MAG: xanthine dehydrogenase family protein molybdopterin-binding subunit [Dehalococcoidia bacterium]
MASQYKVIGQRVPKVGAVEMVRGEAPYGADIHLPGMLYVKVLRSPYAHARIRGIDTSKALALEGVKAVVTGEEMPNVAKGTTFPLGEMPVEVSGIALLNMARNEALFHGHAVAAVAATDPWIAQEALALIEVEYEELPAVFDVEEAMKPGAPIVDPTLRTTDMLRRSVSDEPTNVAVKLEMGRGDVEQGLKEAAVVVEETYVVGQAHQGYIEPQACTARAEPDGRITVWTSVQGSFTVQRQLAAIFGIPLNKIRVVPMEVGGAFGGKIYSLIEPLAVVLAQKTGRPVKLVLTREEVLRASGPGAPGVVKVRSGCRRDGTITAIDCWFAYNAGCLPGSPIAQAAQTCVAPYGKVANIRIQAYDVISNKARVTAYRAPGSPQAAFAVEQNVDAMAKAIGMDPVELRLKNCSEEGDPTAGGRPFGPIGLRQILERMQDHPHYHRAPAGPNRGRGVALGFWGGVGFTSSAVVMIKPDGTASLVVGTVDLTGTRTAFQQMCAEELGLRPDQVDVIVADTETAGYADVSGGSRITYTMSIAIHRACQDALEQLRARAAARFRVEPDRIESADSRFWVAGNNEQATTIAELAASGDGHVVGRASITQRGMAPAFAGHIADVEVDPETGKVKVLRYTAVQDVGRAINPTRVEAQMQGGAVQGIGWALTEEYIYDERGALLNASLLDYRQPVSLDVPMLDTEIIEVPADQGPYGVRGVGEVPIVPTAAVIANAVHSAVGVRTYHMPMTPERVFWAIQKQTAGR